MKSKKLLLITTITLALISLSACSSNKNTKPQANKEALNTLQSKTEPQQDPQVRLKFNDIKTATAADDFKGGTPLEQIKALYGEPKSHTTKPAGDVTLDVYTWDVDGVIISAQLFEDSTIARAISNFAFDRKQTVTKKIYDEKLPNDLTFTEVTEIIGQPDVMSQAVSSDGEQLQALWSSNLKGKDNTRQIELIFKNGKLSEKSQKGLE
ncbi:DUF3862 domain-containing protein [Streptococcus pluranimalium]|uniref:DUF3862 domain-containing protein n=1 Tax=Streptococcus pluranimalium TaxID=82348 RepID=A0A2L0D4E7_9STRE|nr:DUF3862 domain-containing protein [Streptococcus pluranimalium]AUW96451.1 hypothetical protein C0J00_04665 [Streptococcus pluranimalium]AXJ13022.1 hypothetical protein Sp14A_11050 [Streptococcus pluranimalium]